MKKKIIIINNKWFFPLILNRIIIELKRVARKLTFYFAFPTCCIILVTPFWKLIAFSFKMAETLLLGKWIPAAGKKLSLSLFLMLLISYSHWLTQFLLLFFTPLLVFFFSFYFTLLFFCFLFDSFFVVCKTEKKLEEKRKASLKKPAWENVSA